MDLRGFGDGIADRSVDFASLKVTGGVTFDWAKWLSSVLHSSVYDDLAACRTGIFSREDAKTRRVFGSHEDTKPRRGWFAAKPQKEERQFHAEDAEKKMRKDRRD